MKKISRRSFLAAAGLSVAALALTACGGSSASTASSVASSAASSEAASTSAAAGELTTVEAGKLTMATNAAFPPYEMTTDAGEFEGVLPVLVIMTVLSLAARLAGYGSVLGGLVGIFIIVMLPIGILTSYVLWKKGKIQVVDKEQK